MNPMTWLRTMARNATLAGVRDALAEVSDERLAAELADAARGVLPALPAPEGDDPAPANGHARRKAVR